VLKLIVKKITILLKTGSVEARHLRAFPYFILIFKVFCVISKHGFSIGISVTIATTKIY
jgi:hypothetical protein